MNDKTINGFDIPFRELSEEEKRLEITVERFRNFHYEAGEDFLDSTSEGNAFIFCGWLLKKYPKHSEEILRVANTKGKYLGISSFIDLSFLHFNDEEDIERIYFDYSEFCNQTVHLKGRINQVLIQVAEYYN